MTTASSDRWVSGLIGSVLEAASWRLASELVRRHPVTTRILHTHPGGGQYDCLTITSPNGDGGSVQLNRNGTIQVDDRFDGRTGELWEPTDWDDYLRADPRELPRPVGDGGRAADAVSCPAVQSDDAHLPRARSPGGDRSEVGASDRDRVRPVRHAPGTAADPTTRSTRSRRSREELRRTRRDDLFDQAGYRFWIVLRDRVPILAFEQEEGMAWTQHHSEGFDLMGLYESSRHNLLVVTLELLRLVDNV